MIVLVIFAFVAADSRETGVISNAQRYACDYASFCLNHHSGIVFIRGAITMLCHWPPDSLAPLVQRRLFSMLWEILIENPSYPY